MAENFDKLQSIVANSNLVATAGEFIPKFHVPLEGNFSENFQHSCNISQNNSMNMYNFNFESSMTQPDGASFGSSQFQDLNLPHSSREYSKNFSEHSPEQKVRRSDVFFADNEEFSLSKLNQNKPNSRWKRPEVDHFRNRRDKRFSTPGFSRNAENKDDAQNNFYKHSRLSFKNNGSNNSLHNFDRSSGFYENENQSQSLSEFENASWRRKNKFPDSNQSNDYFSRSRNKQNNEPNLFENANNGKGKGNSHKYRNWYKSKELYPNEKEKHDRERAKNNLIKLESDSPVKTNQREQLIDLLTRGILECLVCCESIHQSSPVWNCNNCYHVLHFKCIVKWAKSSKSDFGWRCPACQNVTNKVPQEYICFCGKTRNPEWNHQDCPHSCGEVCERMPRKSCPHKCILLCHPGPCPQCTALVTRSCGCGRTTKTIQCSNSEIVVCDNICGKELNCLIHSCIKNCHVDPCEDCNENVSQDCFCGKEHREVKCTIEVIGVKNFSCRNICNKKLSCGNHLCTLICHEGDCPVCEKAPDLVKFCPCGKSKLDFLSSPKRKSCNDPVPTCDLICDKVLPCSQSGNVHTCQKSCHEGPCPPCPLEASVKCRCGHIDKTVPCSELNIRGGNIRCDKRCTKKRSCGKHKCNQSCCTEIEHECPLPCNRLLQCGLHRCQETCHRGHCKPCLQASFEELSCECGAEVIFPPVPCGTRRPPCERPCTRVHVCNHPPTHNCHSATQCPPCTVLTKKYCHGRHELRKAVPCHQESFSCGLPCGKEIECGRHKCILPCHSGPCLKDDQSCVQPCTIPRPVCGHFCGSPCHEGACPTDTPCKEVVRVTCECGHRYTTRACHDNAKEYQRIATAKLATKMADLQAGQSVDLNDVVSASKKLSYKTLECNEECKLIDRNRRLAIALQIRNPDLSAKLTPRYSDYLKNWAKKDPRFCQMVHDKLTDLVQLAKQSKQKSRSYSFDPMNREKRHFIHEYCEHFGCECVAYDQEPKRNVVATALKDKSWLPSVSIIEFVQKENSPRKVPAPVSAKRIPTSSQRNMEILPSKILQHHSDVLEGTSSNNESQIDYFDWRPQHS